MNRSDWISLVACIGTLLALIPAYSQFAVKKNKKRKSSAISQEQKNEKDEPVKYSAFFRATVLTAMAFVIGIIEIVIFSWIASYFNIGIDINTMPLNWKVGFFLLFLIPAVLLFLALINITSQFKD